MPPRKVALDTNVFLLYLVGSTDRRAITSHRRLKAYDANAYDILCEIVSAYDMIVVTPGCLAETTDLLDYDSHTSKSRFYRALKEMILNSEQIGEEYIPAGQIVSEPTYAWLGIADTSYVELAKQKIPVITTDIKLYAAASGYCPNSLNFTELIFSDIS